LKSEALDHDGKIEQGNGVYKGLMETIGTVPDSDVRAECAEALA